MGGQFLLGCCGGEPQLLIVQFVVVYVQRAVPTPRRFLSKPIEVLVVLHTIQLFKGLDFKKIDKMEKSGTR